MRPWDRVWPDNGVDARVRREKITFRTFCMALYLMIDDWWIWAVDISGIGKEVPHTRPWFPWRERPLGVPSGQEVVVYCLDSLLITDRNSCLGPWYELLAMKPENDNKRSGIPASGRRVSGLEPISPPPPHHSPWPKEAWVPLSAKECLK